MRMALSARHCVLGLALAVLMAWSGTAFGQRPAPSGEGAITRENLFSPTRSPWVPPPPLAQPQPPAKPDPPPPPPPPPQFVLYGVMIMGDERRALLKEPKLTSGRVEQLSLGAQVGPYRLIGIEPDRVVLEKDGVSMTVSVEDPARPKGQVIAIPPPPPPPPQPQPQPAASAQPSAPPQPHSSEPKQETLSEILSKFSERFRPLAQPGQQTPGQPAR